MLALEPVLVSVNFALRGRGMVRGSGDVRRGPGAQFPALPLEPAMAPPMLSSLPPVPSSFIHLNPSFLQSLHLERFKQDVLSPGLYLFLRIWGQKMKHNGNLSIHTFNKNTGITVITGISNELLVLSLCLGLWSVFSNCLHPQPLRDWLTGHSGICQMFCWRCQDVTMTGEGIL